MPDLHLGPLSAHAARAGFWLRIGALLVGIDRDAPRLFSERNGLHRGWIARRGRWRARCEWSPVGGGR